jgi:hypothetical protein
MERRDAHVTAPATTGWNCLLVWRGPYRPWKCCSGRLGDDRRRGSAAVVAGDGFLVARVAH